MPYKPTGKPRGRPKGSKNKPKDVTQFVIESLTAPVYSVKRKPQPPKRKTWLHDLTPEQRSELGKRAAASRNPENIKNAGRKKGVPKRSDSEGHRIAMAEARVEARRIVKKMKKAGQLPEDPRVEEALEATLTIIRCKDTGARDRIAASRLVLDFLKAKPTTKVDVTFSPEDFLDSIIEDDGEDTEE